MTVSAPPDWASEIANAFTAETPIRAVLSNPVSKSADVQKVIVRPVIVGGETRLQWAERRGRQEIHANLTLHDSLKRLQREFPASFRQFNVFTEAADRELRAGPRGEIRVRRSRPSKSAPPVEAHDVAKNYLIPEGTPCGFLEACGVMTPEGRVRAPMQHKFRQINRFLEFVEDVYRDLPEEGTLRMVDFGCGKSYLTFAIRHLLVDVHQREVEILGIDQSPEVIATSRLTTERLGLSGLSFQAADILDADVTGPVHLAVALHACDTATDAALARAVGWESNVILAAPCCQHEVAKMLNAPSLELIASHGILKERFAALATDALRAAALEAEGWRTQVMEFIDLDHTAKNLLIRAVRRERPSDDARLKWRERFDALKTVLGVERVAIEDLACGRP